MSDLAIQPVQSRGTDGKALASGELLSRHAQGIDAPVAQSDSVSSTSNTRPAGESPASGEAALIQVSSKTSVSSDVISDLVARFQAEGHIDAAQLERLAVKLTQSLDRVPYALSVEEQAAIKSLLDQVKEPSSELQVKSGGKSTGAPSIASDVNGVRIDSKVVQSLQQLFHRSAQSVVSPSLPGGNSPDLVIEGLAAGRGNSAIGRIKTGYTAALSGQVATGTEVETLPHKAGVATLARSLAVSLSTGSGGNSTALRVLDQSFIGTTRQVITLLLTDTQPSKPTAFSTTQSASAMTETPAVETNVNPPMNSARLETMMQTLRGIAPFLGGNDSGATLNRLGQMISAIRGAVAELEVPASVQSGRSEALSMSPGMRDLIARGFSFDLTVRPSIKVDSAIATLKANGFEVLRLSEPAGQASQLHITVPGRDPKAQEPIHLDLQVKAGAFSSASPTAQAPADQGQAALSADANPSHIAQLAREAVTVSLAGHGLGDASAATESDPIRQMGIPHSMVSHQLDPLLMGWAAFYELQRPVSESKADTSETFERVTRPPLMLEYKPVEIINPDVSVSDATGQTSKGFHPADILDVENFKVS